MMDRYPAEVKEFEEKVVQINRISKKTKGGNHMRFAALVVSGDRKGRVGVGLAKAADVQSAVAKATRSAKKALFTINLHGTTIPHEVNCHLGAAHVLLSLPLGHRVKAGGQSALSSNRLVLETSWEKSWNCQQDFQCLCYHESP